MKTATGRLLPPLPLIIPALISGLLLAVTFPTAGAWPVVFIALVPLLAALLVNRPGLRDSFKAGYLFGVFFFVCLLWWIARLIPSADVNVPGLMVPAVLLLALYYGAFAGVFALAVSAVTRFRRLAFVVAVAPLWLLVDMVRFRGALALPWGAPGYALSAVPALIQTAALTGVHGLTFVVVLVNALLAIAVVEKSPRTRVACVVLALTSVAGLWSYGRVAMKETFDVPGRAIRVALLQPNVDLEIKWKSEFRDSTFRLIDRLGDEAGATGADLVIFPETCAPIYIEAEPQYKNRLIALARRLQRPVYIGFLDYRYDGPGNSLNIYNSSAVIMPDGAMTKYDKIHLLQFGESLPMSTRLRWLRKIEFGQSNFEPGSRDNVLDAGVLSFTPLICFESVFPGLCRSGVRRGAQLFINITNDGWFADTPGPYQHAQMSIMRAVEFRRYLVRSANSGISWVVTPTGVVRERLGTFVPGLIVSDVVALDGQTVYARFGDRPLLAVGLILVLVAFVLSRRGERPQL